MKKLVIVLVTVFALSFFYFFTKERATGPELRAPIQERYKGGDFTMTLPTGSTPVKVQNSTKSVGEQQMVQNAYSFSNSTVSYRIQVNDYSSRTEGTPEESSRATASEVFNPGYSASFSNSHLGLLSAAATGSRRNYRPWKNGFHEDAHCVFRRSQAHVACRCHCARPTVFPCGAGG
jgi:hypothetical protein